MYIILIVTIIIVILYITLGMIMTFASGEKELFVYWIPMIVLWVLILITAISNPIKEPNENRFETYYSAHEGMTK